MVQRCRPGQRGACVEELRGRLLPQSASDGLHGLFDPLGVDGEVGPDVGAGQQRSRERGRVRVGLGLREQDHDGTVAAFIDDVVAFPHKQRPSDLQRFLDACLAHDATDRLAQITAPTLVLAGGKDSTARPVLGRAVAARIPGAVFEVLEDEAHQPFQEVPDAWNARVDRFWTGVAAGSAPRPAAMSVG
jgi:pimeloyl-ACP methyl ester carboxylesterase